MYGHLRAGARAHARQYVCVCVCVCKRQSDHTGALSELKQDGTCFPSRMLGRFDIEGSEQRRDKSKRARGRRGVDEPVR